MLIFRPGNISKTVASKCIVKILQIFVIDKGELFNITKFSFDTSGEKKENWVELSLPGRDFNTAGSCAIELKNRMFIFGGLEPYKHQVSDP